MYHGQQAGSSLSTPDNASRSPSDSIDLSPIEAMARPMEMDQFNKPRLSSDPMAASRSLNTPPVPYGLMNFYAGDDSPWVGFNMPASASAQPSHHMNPVDVSRNAPAFASWRSNGQPSECGTIPQAYLPSDSGYESRAKHSIVDDRSVYEENTETQSLAGHMMEFNPFPLSTSTFRDAHVQAWPPAPPAPVQTGPTDKLICPDCQALCKTKSELNKHNQRHRKAFKCEVPGCTRKEGFGTPNDLDRHKSSVHPELDSGPRWRCNISAQCQAKDKLWPRADNFRQHLKRVHNQPVSADDDLNQYLWHPSQKPQETSRTVQEDLEGVGSELFNFGSDSQGWEISSPEQPMEMDDLLVDPSLTNIDETSNIPLVQNHHAFVQPTQISRPPSTIKPLLPGGRTRDGEAHITVDFPKSLDACSDNLKESPMDSVNAMDCDLAPKAPESESENERASSQKPAAGAWSSAGEVLNEQDALRILEKLPKEVIAKFLKGQSDQKPSHEPTTSIEAHRCTKLDCGKTFNRRCELKKHMKRHDKPYGCTFSGCSKRFGSKNDWKRHENSQHFQLEVWKCSEKRTDDDNTQTETTCGKVCHRRETFRSHLQKEHKMEDASQVDKALEDCRVGRNCESRFWCGFCVKIIEITKKGANAWTERFNHIDNHYAGRDNVAKKDISEWKNVDPELHEIDFAGSVDDSSDAESCDEATASHKPSGLAMKSTMTRKRGADDDNDEREPKRFKDARITQRWNCCNCSHDFDIKTTPACIQCSHQRCTRCEEQQVLVR
ncbi:Metallothionein expression activator [Colletotrichum tropicale]|nr:Metallothionein expression activator [Colletotrichum tropicale]